jgi:hypothetical protein
MLASHPRRIDLRGWRSQERGGSNPPFRGGPEHRAPSVALPKDTTEIVHA